MSTNSNCACLALYDWDREIDTVSFHALAKDFFDANLVAPKVCGIAQPNEKDRTTSYARISERLRSEPLREADGLSLYHTLPDYAQLMFGWDVMAGLSFVLGRMMIFCCDQSIRGLDLDYFDRMLDRIGEMVSLRYGIGYVRTFELGPSVYAAGMVTGIGYNKKEIAEADRIGAWFRERMARNRHLTGYLRDVYPLNVISEKHLSQSVAGVRLADWIEKSPARGTLRALAGDATLWRIDETHVEAVRAELAPSGILIAYPRAAS
jgi:hypothetical protein